MPARNESRKRGVLRSTSTGTLPTLDYQSGPRELGRPGALAHLSDVKGEQQTMVR